MTQPNQPDTGNYYADLAAALREVADRVATLADRDLPAMPYAHLFFCAYSVTMGETLVPAVDAIAGLFDKTPETRGRNAYGADAYLGPVTVMAETSMPKREDEAERLREENEHLRRQLAEARATQQPATVFPAAAPRPQPAVEPVDVSALPPLVEPRPLTDPALAADAAGGAE